MAIILTYLSISYFVRMKKYLSVHIILEFLGGICLFLYPNLLFYGGESIHQAIPVIKLYGLLAVCFSLAYAFVNLGIKEKSKVFIQFYLLAMAFQLFITFQCYGLLNSAYLSHGGAFYVHLAAFIALTIGYFLHRFEGKSDN